MTDGLTGMIPATLTPFTPAGAVNVAALHRHVGFLVESGISVLAPAGTTGEFLYLSEEERALVVRETVRAAPGRAAVIAGIWALDTAGVGRLARAAEAAGAAAVFLTTPIYYPATDAAVLAWYRSAREHTGLPLFAYSIPQYAVNTVSPAVLDRLLADGVVQGIKDSSGKEERVASLLETTAGRGAVYGASDSFTLTARRLGATGFISALANAYPRACLRIWSGPEADAARAQAEIDQVRTAVKGYGGLGGLKALLRARGHDFGPTRLPFGNLTSEEEAALAAAVARFSALE
jgi:4-hydroxy-tetrahydrodipicolinate synthase